MPTAKINGLNFGYDVHGNGEPLILLTGLGGDRKSWFFQINDLKEIFQVLTCDSRGIGATDVPDKPFTIKTMADDIICLMNHLNIDRAHILGISMGGMIAQEIAINYPERVNKLILVSTYLAGEEMANVTTDMQKILGLGPDFSKDDANEVDIEEFMQQVAALSFNTEKYRRIFIPMSQQYLKRMGVKGFNMQLEAASGCTTIDRIHTIKSSTLVMVGTGDRIVPPCSSEKIADKIPNAKLVMIEDGSHAMNLEISDRFNKEIINFLADP